MGGLRFVPMVMEADSGSWGLVARQTWAEMAKGKSQISGETQSVVASRILQSLSVILHKVNEPLVLSPLVLVLPALKRRFWVPHSNLLRWRSFTCLCLFC